MVQKVKSWLEILPGWIPIVLSVFGAALWIGQYTQSINDRLKAVEEQIKAIQEYMRSEHQPKNTGANHVRDYDDSQDAISVPRYR